MRRPTFGSGPRSAASSASSAHHRKEAVDRRHVRLGRLLRAARLEQPGGQALQVAPGQGRRLDPVLGAVAEQHPPQHASTGVSLGDDARAGPARSRCGPRGQRQRGRCGSAHLVRPVGHDGHAELVVWLSSGSAPMPPGASLGRRDRELSRARGGSARPCWACPRGRRSARRDPCQAQSASDCSPTKRSYSSPSASATRSHTQCQKSALTARHPLARRGGARHHSRRRSSRRRQS